MAKKKKDNKIPWNGIGYGVTLSVLICGIILIIKSLLGWINGWHIIVAEFPIPNDQYWLAWVVIGLIMYKIIMLFLELLLSILQAFHNNIFGEEDAD